MVERSDFGIAANPDVGDDTVPWVSINGEIQPSGDVDYFRFDLQEGESLTLDVDYGDYNLPDRVNTLLQLFDATGLLLAENDNADATLGGAGSPPALQRSKASRKARRKGL